jgi:hypothetical protein
VLCAVRACIYKFRTEFRGSPPFIIYLTQPVTRAFLQIISDVRSLSQEIAPLFLGHSHCWDFQADQHTPPLTQTETRRHTRAKKVDFIDDDRLSLLSFLFVVEVAAPFSFGRPSTDIPSESTCFVIRRLVERAFSSQGGIRDLFRDESGVFSLLPCD